MELKKEFTLLPQDQGFLKSYGLPWETVNSANQEWVLVHDFPLPEGYTHPTATAAIRIETGYPHAQLDMVYFFPAISRKDGVSIGATNATQSIDGKIYQRWSRHRSAVNPWNPKQDHIGTHIFLIEDWLEREFEK